MFFLYFRLEENVDWRQGWGWGWERGHFFKQKNHFQEICVGKYVYNNIYFVYICTFCILYICIFHIFWRQRRFACNSGGGISSRYKYFGYAQNMSIICPPCHVLPRRQLSEVRQLVAAQRTITRFGNNEPKDRCIKWKIQTVINAKACKRYARGDSKHKNS